MKDLDEKIVFAFYGVFGAVLGLLVFMVPLGGWLFVLTGDTTRPWRDALLLIICLAIGGGWGLIAYKHRHREIDVGMSNLYKDGPGAILFVKRLMVIATCAVAVYYIWDLARGL